MATLADKAILSGVDNRLPMLEKELYNSWKSIMELYMMNRQNGRVILESVENGPLIWPMIEENGVTRPRKYSELTPAEALQADCDVKATNIILQGTSLTKQERECKLYDEFDKFAYKKGEILRDFYLRFSLLLNDLNIYDVKLKQFQVNTKFLNSLPREWSKFVTDFKLVRDFHTTNIDQLHAYLEQHEFYANEVGLMHELNQQHPEFSPPDLGLNVTMFKHGDDHIDAINHMMSFLTSVITSRFPTTNNKLRNSSNPRQQATINDGIVTLQLVQGRQTTFAASNTRTLTLKTSGSNSGKQRTVICYTCKGGGNMSKECTKPKRKRYDSWFKDKVMLVQAQANGQILHEEELAFLADPEVALMVNLSQYGSDVLAKNSMNSLDPNPSTRPIKVEVLKELPKVSIVNTSLKKLKHHLAGFDVVVKERTTPTAITEGSDKSISNQSAPSFDQYFEFNKLKAQSQEKDMVIKKLKERIKSLIGNKDKIKNDLEEIEMINIELDHRVSKLIAKNEHLKQTIKQLYDSIKSTRVQSKDQCDELVNQVNQKSMEISDLNISLQEKDLVITALKNDLRKLKGKAIFNDDVTSHKITPEMLKVNEEPLAPKLLNNMIAYFDYLRQLRNKLQTCPCINNLRDKLVTVTPMNKAKRVRFIEPVTSLGNTNTKTTSSSNLVSNKPVLSSIGVRPSTSASGSQPSGNTKKDKIQQPPSSLQKNKVETHPRTVKSSWKNKNCAVEPKGTASVQHSKLNANSELICVKCNGFMLSDNHELCVLNDENAHTKSKFVVQIVLWYLDSGCSKHMTEERSQLTNFVSKFLGTVKFENDHVVKIKGYGDYQIGNVTISKVYYVEGLGHNLFSVGQFCDLNLEVAFCQHTCFIRNLDGVDLLTGS
nr:integrase, catalytic region, zinc finger, CCHC-type, peptidase aspartic, catalytic [Tanacetum cinerariifolium]